MDLELFDDIGNLLNQNFVVHPSLQPPCVHPDRIYQIIKPDKKRGIVLLINNVLFKKAENRPGSLHDAHNIIHTFSQIGYHVSYRENLEEQVISNN